MNIITRIKERQMKRTDLAVAALVVGSAGLFAGRADAAALKPGRSASELPAAAHVGHPKLKGGLLTIEGKKSSDELVLRLRAGDAGVLELDVGGDGSADFDFVRADVARIEVDAGDGDDVVRVDESNGTFGDIPMTIAGGAGADTLAGGSGAELLLGGDGNDSIDGNKGNDVAFMGAGDDIFVWDPGDGSDVVEGQGGSDTMVFNGAGAAEQVDLSAVGGRLRFFRNPGTITMDTRGVERVDFNALGGADVVTINDLTGTDVTSVNVDLAGTLGGATGDGLADRVVVNGTNGSDAITVTGDAGGVKASGLAAAVKIVHSEAANDHLEINTLAGTDTVDSAGLAPDALQLFVDGQLVP
jgi:RTX calcium-binding nonapeptide repeat (4 copies)